MNGRRSSAPALGPQVRVARKDRGLGLRELAELVGMSPSSLSEFERGRSLPSADRVEALAAAVGVTLETEQPAQVVPVFHHWREYDEFVVDPVFQAGLELFVERGYHGSTMRMIAERCDITVAGVYHYVESKHDLLIALMRRAMGEMLARARAASEEGTSPEQRLANVVESLVRFHVLRLPWGYLATNEIRPLEGEVREEMIEQRILVLRVLLDTVIECRGGPDLTGAVGDWVTTRAIITMCAAIPSWYNDAHSPPPEVVVDQYVALARAMVYS